jgi:hypothetical protein
MPRVRVRIHPTGHLEVQVEGLADDRCHALVDEAAARVGVIVQRRPLPPAPGGATVETNPSARRIDRASARIGSEPRCG